MMWGTTLAAELVNTGVVADTREAASALRELEEAGYTKADHMRMDQ